MQRDSNPNKTTGAGLCITVKPGGIVRIGDNIQLWVERCPANPNNSRIHIKAPESVFIQRPDTLAKPYVWMGGKDV